MELELHELEVLAQIAELVMVMLLRRVEYESAMPVIMVTQIQVTARYDLVLVITEIHTEEEFLIELAALSMLC
jgi:hypothetical protein